MPRSELLRDSLEKLGNLITLLGKDGLAPPGKRKRGDAGTVFDRLQDIRQELKTQVAGLDEDARLGRLAVELARLFAASSAPHEFSSAALEAIGHVMSAAGSYVLVFDEDGENATILAARRTDKAPAPDQAPGISRSVLNKIITTRSTILVSDALKSHLDSSVIALNLRSILATPLVLDNRVGGAIYLENSVITDAFAQKDKTLLESIASLLAPYLQAGRRLQTAIDERERLESTLAGSPYYKDIITRSPAMTSVLSMIERLRASDAPVLVHGESGTGKELVARALHYSGRRAAGPLVPVNCAAIPEGLMESELFGHERGAFTGATERKKGKFEQANGGTLFLDEVAELRHDLQAKLLRVLQEQTFERVGGSETISVDVRIVAATNKDLKKTVAEGKFREDLYYRLEVVPMYLPPLRDRSEDIPLLARRFLSEFAAQTGKAVSFDPEVFDQLRLYPFPGNVRELRNLVYRLVALAPSETVTASDLPEYVTGARSVSLEKDPFRRFLRQAPQTNEELKSTRGEMEALFETYVRKLEGRFLKGLLERTGGNISEAARLAGMNRTFFHKKLAEVGEE